MQKCGYLELRRTDNVMVNYLKKNALHDGAREKLGTYGCTSCSQNTEQI
jgi:hypothetical protein